MYFRLFLVPGLLALLFRGYQLSFFPDVLPGNNAFFCLVLFLLTLGLVGWRTAYSWLVQQPFMQEKVYILGTGERAQRLVQGLRQRKELGVDVIGCHCSTPQHDFNGGVHRRLLPANRNCTPAGAATEPMAPSGFALVLSRRYPGPNRAPARTSPTHAPEALRPPSDADGNIPMDPGQHGALVTENVPEHILGQYYIEASRIQDQLHRAIVNQKDDPVLHLDTRQPAQLLCGAIAASSQVTFDLSTEVTLLAAPTGEPESHMRILAQFPHECRSSC